MNNSNGPQPTPVLTTFQRAKLRVRWRFRNLKNLADPATALGLFIAPAALFIGTKGTVSPDVIASINRTIANPVVIAALGVIFVLALSGVVTILSRRVFLQSDEYRSPRIEPGGGLEPKKQTGMDYFATLALASRSVAGTLFSRSGVYLIVGVMTAIFGIVLFFVTRSFMSPPAMGQGGSQIEYAVYLMQNAGVLILCELIAFFFLRQSRSVLDEFRHFDNLARYREEMLALLMMAKEENSGLTVQDILEKGHFFSRSDRLGSGESTELIESRKLEKGEIDLLAKIAEVVAASRKP